MRTYTSVFASYSVHDIAAAKRFYGEVLELPIIERPEGLELKLPACTIFMYPKPDHVPATFTVANFVVSDIDAEVAHLGARGVAMERFPNLPADERGVMRNDGNHPGPKAIAWFRDPSGNVLALIQEK